MKLHSLAVAVLIAGSLVVPGTGVPGAPVAQGASAAQVSRAVSATTLTARPRATATATYTTLASAKVRLVVTSNAKRVQVRYRTRGNSKRSATITLRRGTGAKTLPAGAKKIAVRPKATTTLRTGRWTAATPAKTPPDITAPGMVTGLALGPITTTSIALLWTNPTDSDLAGIIVRRAAGTSAPAGPDSGTAVGLPAPTAQGVIDSGLAAGTTYTYAVFTRDSTGNTSAAATLTAGTLALQPPPTTAPPPDTAAPGLVTGLQVETITTTTVSLTWTNPTDGDLAAILVRRTTGTSAPGNPDSGAAVPLPTPTAQGVIDSGLAANTTYTYAVFTRDTAGNTSAGATVTGTTEPQPPPPPDTTAPGLVTGLTVTTGTATSITLSWANPLDSDLATVIVRRATGKTAPDTPEGGIAVALQSTTAEGVTDTGLTAATTYSYAVFTRDTAGNTSGAATYMGATTPLAAAIPKLALGNSHTCALAPDGTVKCWGNNADGQLGDGTTTSRAAPAPVPDLTGVTSIAGGFATTCAVLPGGTVACWGYAIGSPPEDTTIPTVLPGISGVIALASGRYHMCGLLAGGSVVCWGGNWLGQLGDGTTTYRATATPVLGVTGATGITAGQGHACALVAGEVVCWGWNRQGQIGDGTNIDKPTPTTVPGITGARAVMADNGNQTCALLSNGSISCWGDNIAGQLGDGTTNNSNTPTAVLGITNATGLTTGFTHTCAVLADGTLSCWGDNGSGQLGDGTTIRRTNPDAVAGLRNTVAVTAGWYHMCAVATGGTVYCWGNNTIGQVGDGTLVSRSTPTEVPGVKASLP